ncbi:hypothetical protein VIBNISO65_1510034 [Vibrio nigripulchritudo SO65]|uniref:hypothetical protein n=1 Tax=Vibrio nigripulchritudo TaxID=28173 RepID=UPI0003B1C7EA|nr:hypothetical protein [Vibrio nigripulchritudo]CCN32981.1 hypothetical protein VIBNIAM115_1060034 [Vibrio nigripulchritudo AM115]CCN44126.1 hypothetical protein VIBNIFTn2_700081 [Vibrio nigripulchritudo FTn2]CCN64326.1 hypothetical protein VIBNIPon4_200083 [Vibrio nigripulchritudo POn4]CCN76084.1 hypothetical protein VIBNISO65_1510034 [Vibrio nigripulchritudo SO65]
MRSNRNTVLSDKIIIDELRSSDYEELLPLITPPNLGYVDQERLRRIFQPQDPDTVTGLAMRDSGRLVGCLGFISQQRISRAGQLVKTVNLTCAVSHSDYRGYGLKSLTKLREYFDHTVFTVISASAVSDAIARKLLGAREESDRFQIILSNPNVPDILTVQEAKNSLNILNEELQSIYFSHEDLECHQLVFKDKENQCYLISRTVLLDGESCTEIVFYSDSDAFSKYANEISSILNERNSTKHCVLSISDTPTELVNENHQIMMKEPRITFGLKADIPFISLYSENLILGL